MAAMAIPFSTAAAGAFFYFKRKCYGFNVFKDRGIPGPEPHPIFGNLRELSVDDRHEVIRKWSSEYGPIFGFYEGTKPVCVISDLDLIEHLCLRQTQNCSGRDFATGVQPDSDEDPKHPLLSMMIAKSAHWKIVRFASSHFFSPMRLTQTIPTIEAKIVRLQEIIDHTNGEAIDVREPFQRYAMDALCSVAFGVELNLLDKEHPLHEQGMAIYNNARKMVQNGVVASPWLFKLITVFPVLSQPLKALVHVAMKMPTGPLAPLHGLLQLLKNTITQYKSSKVEGSQCPFAKRNLLQELCQATKFPEEEQLNATTSGKRNYLTEEQLMTNVVMFLLAGYETTSTTLGIATYLLATHPEVQEKLFAEIQEHFPDPEKTMDYETVMNKMEYLNWIVMEVVRLFPEGINIINRFITEKTMIRGIELDEGMHSILVDTWTVHMNHEYWGPVNPETFHPERFSPDYETANRPKSAFLGFGIGPRQCAGKLFAMLELKLTLARLVRSYKLLPPSEDAPKLLPVKVHLVMIPKGEVNVKLVRRQ